MSFKKLFTYINFLILPVILVFGVFLFSSPDVNATSNRIVGAEIAQATPASSTPAATSLVPDACNGKCPLTGDKKVATDKAGLANIFLGAARFLTYVGGALSVLFLVYGGVRYIFSSDDAEKARTIIRNSVIGLIVVILAYTLVSVLSNLLNGEAASGILGGTG